MSAARQRSNRTPLAWLEEELAQLDRDDLRRTLIDRQGPQAPSIVLDGQESLNFGSNDYLALAADPSVCEAARRTLEAEGWGAGASGLVCGHGSSHRRLERRLAQFEQTEAALLFPTGFAANMGTIAALAGRGDTIFSDAKNHASIIDGARLSRAKICVYRHADCRHLDEMLRQAGDARRRLIVTDSLFSMDGDLAPLVEIAELAERHAATLMVDEAHATGVFGRDGRGVAEALGVEDRVDVRVGTLSKAFGGLGGFVAGSQSLIDWLANRARSFMFSTAAPAASCAASLAALEVIAGEPHRRRELLDRAADLRRRLTEIGWRVGPSASQIIPVVVGESREAIRLARELRRRGMFVPGIRPPTVPPGEALLRLSLRWDHREEMIERLVAAFAELANE